MESNNSRPCTRPLTPQAAQPHYILLPSNSNTVRSVSPGIVAVSDTDNGEKIGAETQVTGRTSSTGEAPVSISGTERSHMSRGAPAAVIPQSVIAPTVDCFSADTPLLAQYPQQQPRHQQEEPACSDGRDLVAEKGTNDVLNHVVWGQPWPGNYLVW